MNMITTIGKRMLVGRKKRKTVAGFLFRSAPMAALLLLCSTQCRAQNYMITSPQDVMNIQRDIANRYRNVNRYYGSRSTGAGNRRSYVPNSGSYSPAARRSLDFITGFNRDTAHLLQHPNDRRSDAIRRRGVRDIATQKMLNGGMRYFPSSTHYN